MLLARRAPFVLCTVQRTRVWRPEGAERNAVARTSTQKQPAIVLFDGVCNLCNASVTFIIDRDPQGMFRFAPLQSEAAQRLVTHNELPVHGRDSVVLLEAGQIYTQSTAALRIARRLSGWWPLVSGLMVVPQPIRDGVYRWIARNRYRWFGQTPTCRVPTPELRQRFL